MGTELAYAQQLAKYMATTFYQATDFEVLETISGVLSQIDNMLTGLQRIPNDEH